MQISLIENGVDSLTKGFEHLKKYEEMFFIDRTGPNRFFTLKDAILNVNHGIEILFKQILLNKNELLVFSDIDSTLKKSFKEKNQKKLQSIFQVDNSPHTVTLREAIDRLAAFCDIQLDQKLATKINQLEKYRNQITHSAVFLSEEEINKTFDGLIDCIDTFFIRFLANEYTSITGYDILKQTFKEYKTAAINTENTIKNEAIERLINAFEKSGVSMGQNSAKIITDIDVATQIINLIQQSNLRFGGDFYNLHCSGSISKVKRIADNIISIDAEDNRTEYQFKFKGLVIYLPEINGNFSPIFFFEADNLDIDDSLKQFIKKSETLNISELNGIIDINSHTTIYDLASIDEDDYSYHEIKHLNKFLTEGIVCFINVQGLNYGRVRSTLGTEMTLKELQVALNQK